jgi:hypothetical protein
MLRGRNEMAFTETFTVQALAPFNFDLSAQIFSSGDPQISSYANGELHQVLRLDGSLVLVKLTSKGTIQQPKIAVELKFNKTQIKIFHLIMYIYRIRALFIK